MAVRERTANAVEVAVVFPSAGPTGGVERVAAELLRYESKRRPTGFVGTTLDPGVRDDAHPVTHMPVTPRRVPRAWAPVAFRRASARVLARARPTTTVSFGVQSPPGDIVWVHSVHAAWLDRGTPAVVRGREVPARLRGLLLRHRVLLSLERAYFTDVSARAVLCTSTQEVEDLAYFYGVPRELTYVVPNGFNAKVFDVRRRPDLRAVTRRRLGMSEDDLSILVVANEWHRKGLGTVLQAVARVGDPRLRVDLVGLRPPTGYDELAARLGLTGRMRWHGPSADVAPYYAAADVFALPTTYEPFGIVIVEAMAMGLPVVVPALAGASAAIRSGSDGIVLDEPRDVEELAGALSELLDPDVRERLGAAAPAAVTHLAWGQVLERADSLIFAGG